MEQPAAFLPERQFHVLISINETERSIAVLPNEDGKFLVVDQGKILGQMHFDQDLNCVSCEGELDKAILKQLKIKIKEYTEDIGLFKWLKARRLAFSM